MEIKKIKISSLRTNTGQIEGLPKNPRLIKGDKFDKLKKSIEENPEMLHLRELIVMPFEDNFVVIGGNMRLSAMKELGFKEAICKVLSTDTSVQQLKAYTIKDNVGFGEHDWDALANEWEEEELSEWGLDLPVNQNWEQLEYIDENLPAPQGRKDNLITITVPDELLSEMKEIEELIKETIRPKYSGCEIK